MAYYVQLLSKRSLMVVCIEEYVKKIHRPSAADIQAAPLRVQDESDEDGPNDDPPAARRLAA